MRCIMAILLMVNGEMVPMFVISALRYARINGKNHDFLFYKNHENAKTAKGILFASFMILSDAIKKS